MTKVRSASELVDKLAENISWRRQEVSTMWLSVQRARKGQLPSVSRSFVCILYAHWEGFVKDAAELYLSFVACSGYDVQRLGTNFLAASLRSRIQSCGRSRDPVQHRELVDNILRSPPPFRYYDGIVDTKSNVDEEVFTQIADLVGVDLSSYRASLPKITELRNTRNSIAHGRRQTPTVDDCEEYKSRVMLLISQFRDDIENAACTEAFLADNGPGT